MQRFSAKVGFWLLIAAVAAGAAFFYWQHVRQNGYGPAFVSGNGRIEATEIDIATKFSGRVKDITVNEGDFVQAGQPLAYMNISSLQAQLDEAKAQLQQARHGVASAQAQVVARRSDHAAALAIVSQRETELLLARQHLQRSERLVTQGATSRQTLDEHRAGVSSALAVLEAAKAQVAAAAAAIEAAQAQVIGAESAVRAAQATVQRIQADIDDSVLVSPRDGRVQFRVAQPGEVVSAGGKLLNVVDLTDVYMTFFLPETVAGKVALGAPVRIVLDAAPGYVIPANISFVASTAQFTPKTVETASERQKLMFRVKARLEPELLRKYLAQVKTGLPGVAWVQLDQTQDWPQALQERLPD